MSEMHACICIPALPMHHHVLPSLSHVLLLSLSMLVDHYMYIYENTQSIDETQLFMLKRESPKHYFLFNSSGMERKKMMHAKYKLVVVKCFLKKNAPFRRSVLLNQFFIQIKKMFSFLRNIDSSPIGPRSDPTEKNSNLIPIQEKNRFRPTGSGPILDRCTSCL